MRLVASIAAVLLAAACGSSDGSSLSNPKFIAQTGTGGVVVTSTGGTVGTGGVVSTGGTAGAGNVGQGGSGGLPPMCTDPAGCRDTTCQSDVDCDPSGPGKCDPITLQCVRCVTGDDCGPGSECQAGECAFAIDAGPPAEPDAGNPFPDGAWAPCTADDQCTGGRVCTSSVQELIVPGRSGACVQRCFVGTTNCDPPLPGTMAFCSFGMCSIPCPSSGGCPEGFDCQAGYCFHSP